MELEEPLLVVEDLHVHFKVGAFGARKVIRAVDGVSLQLCRGETIGLVGESGSGKTTLGRAVLRLYEPTSGKVIFEGVDITHMPERKLRPLRRKMQLVPQDPFTSLNPLQTVGDALTEPLVVHGIVRNGVEARERALKMLERVGLVPPEEFYNVKPHNLSGGQRQRVAIARAFLLEPILVVADEPTSNLDVSIRASILELLKEFKERYRQGMIFITHDLAVARLIADEIAVMYLGKIVEHGPTKRVLTKPLHPYTTALLRAVPRVKGKTSLSEVELKGEVPDPSKPPKGCRLHPRCPLAKPKCSEVEPQLVELDKDHYVACHNPLL
ncbi:MAG: oligopeptide ABC transporter ATP-binding protein [Thermoprotei archaeon]|nr:MAG: oligopeptide ABC transporter ATP-binding protein [Thermoprotei archaeon]